MKIRSVLETSAVVFHSMLNNENTCDLERVQKNVVRTVMGRRHVSYEASLEFLQLETLEERREQICLTFALKCLASRKYNHLFEPVPLTCHNLRETRKLFEPTCQTE